MRYRVEFKNLAKIQVAFFLYIKPPELPRDTISVSCFRRLCHPGVGVDFVWEENLCFLWGEIRNLSPGTVVCSGLKKEEAALQKGFYYSEVKTLQSWKKNKIGISCLNNSFVFTDCIQEVESGKLGVFSDGAVVSESIAAGIGLLDQDNKTVCGSIVNKMEPNRHFIYVTDLCYMVTFSQDLNKPDTAYAMELNFPEGYNMAHVTLDNKNVLQVEYSTEI